MSDDPPNKPKPTRAMALETLAKDADDLIHDRRGALKALAHSLTIVQSLPTHCRWQATKDGDFNVWETSCGSSFALNKGTPEENYLRYCQYCGSLVVSVISVIEHEQPTSDE